MKVYQKIVIDINGKTIEEDSYEYFGPVAGCWTLAAVAAISAASAIYTSEMAAARKPGPGGASVGGKKSFEMPDLFKNKGGSLMGGGAAPGGETPLSQKLNEPASIPQPAPPQFGPAGGGAFDETKRQRMLNSLMGGR